MDTTAIDAPTRVLDVSDDLTPPEAEVAETDSASDQPAHSPHKKRNTVMGLVVVAIGLGIACFYTISTLALTVYATSSLN